MASIQARELWHRMLDGVRVASRRLTRRPFAALISVVSIAIAIAAVGATASVLLTTDVRQLPFASAERLTKIYTRLDAASSLPGEEGPALSYALFSEFRQRVRSFDHLEAVSSPIKRASAADGNDETVKLHAATPGFLAMLGVQPLAGRWFVAADTLATSTPTIVLSYPYWMSRYGGDRGIIGKKIELSERFPATAPAIQYTVIGVLPRSFTWDETRTAWLPMSQTETASRRAVSVVGRLRPDVSLRAAAAELRAIGGDLTSELEASRPPGERLLGGKLEVHAESLRAYLHDRVGGTATRVALLAVALCAFILALANVVFLTVIDAQGRRGEFAVRRALGAASRRLMQQTLTEALLITVPATLAAIVFCRLLIALIADKLEVAALGSVPTLDAATLAALGGCALLITIAVALAPMLTVGGRELAASLAARGNTRSFAGVVLSQRALVFVECAMALVVLTAAGLVVKNLARLEFRELGYEPNDLVLLTAPVTRPQPAADVRAYGERALTIVAHTPGVAHAALMATDLMVHLRSDAISERLPVTVPRAVVDVSPDLFGTMGITIERGRGLTGGDDASQPAVVVLSAEAARRLFPATNPLGRRVALAGMASGASDVWATVVGVAADAHVGSDPASPKQAVVYRPFAQADPFLVRVVADVPAATTTLAALRAAIAPLNEGPRSRWTISVLEQDVAQYLAAPRFAAISLSVLSSIGLLLAVAGIFAVTALSVALRSREIAIRVALGADAGGMMSRVIRETAWPVALGVLAGLWASVGVSRLLRAFVQSVDAIDLRVALVASLVLVTAALVAAVVPARRVLRIDPAEALRFE